MPPSSRTFAAHPSPMPSCCLQPQRRKAVPPHATVWLDLEGLDAHGKDKSVGFHLCDMLSVVKHTHKVAWCCQGLGGRVGTWRLTFCRWMVSTVTIRFPFFFEIGSPGWLGIPYLDQANLSLEMDLLLLPKYWD